MTAYYIEHGLYKPAASTFTGTFTSSSTSITGIADTSIFRVGQQLTHANFAANVQTLIATIASGTSLTLTTYTAGAGTGVQIGYMPNPAWDSAYDGDGTTTGAATPATVSIDLAAYTAAAGATFVVCGATLTCVASGAGNNQFNAGSGQTLADNLVAAINRAGNTVVVNAAATGWTTHLVQNAVRARRTSTAVLEIQTKAGSATYNSNTLWKIVSTGLTGGSQLDATFSGGAGGAWGWLFADIEQGNFGTIGCMYYGAWYSQTSGTTIGPLAGVVSTQSDDDIFHIRANGKEAWFMPHNYYTLYPSRKGTFLVDDGTKWNGDTGTFLCATKSTGSAGINMQLSGTVSFAARQLGKWIWRNSGNACYMRLGAYQSSHVVYRNLLLDDVGAIANSEIRFGLEPSANVAVYVYGCKIEYTRNFHQALAYIYSGGSSDRGLFVHDSTFSYPNYTGTPSEPLIALLNFPAEGRSNIGVFNCTVSAPNAGGAISAVTTTTTTNIYNNIIISNVSGNVVPNNGLGLAGKVESVKNDELGYILQQGIGNNRQFRYETGAIAVDWTPGSGYPTLDSLLPDSTPWSYKVLWTNIASNYRGNSWYQATAVSKTITQSSQQTVAVEMLFSSTVEGSVKTSDIGMWVTYIADSDSKQYTESIYDFADAGVALAAGSASWTKNSFSTYVAKKLSLTLARTIKVNTEVDVQIRLLRAAPELTTFFVNPEPTVS